MSPSPRSPAKGSQRRPYAARVPAAQRREQLLDAALTVAMRDGFGAVTVDAIAREAGVTRPVVYGAYDRLGDLLDALLDRQQQRALAQLGAAMPTLEELARPDGLDQAVRRLIAMLREDPATWEVILVARGDAPAAVQERIEADRQRWVQQTAALLELGLGSLTTSPDVLAEALLALCEHFGQVILSSPDRFGDDQLVALARSLVGSFRRRG